MTWVLLKPVSVTASPPPTCHVFPTSYAIAPAATRWFIEESAENAYRSGFPSGFVKTSSVSVPWPHETDVTSAKPTVNRPSFVVAPTRFGTCWVDPPSLGRKPGDTVVSLYVPALPEIC